MNPWLKKWRPARPVAKAVVLLIYLYRYLIRPLLPPSCRFYPSCSQYSLEALNRYNVVWALWLTALRLLKCHPFHPGGFDPLPETQPRASLPPGSPAPRTP